MVFGNNAGVIGIKRGLFRPAVIHSRPTVRPSDPPTDRPTHRPTDPPTDRPTHRPTNRPTDRPSAGLPHCVPMRSILPLPVDV
ncbi:hypothetical protein BV898_09699 [Hypsibius exemplaris]|uniref:Uncharacterized protein n=1 Tax=Hypsibius exemplaris TaxID=2072580 RepID=A0A1W0WLY6_HYPEX|nr:hypothetical protein BV898_09699 [Hypsibius exemplaris]